MFPETERQIFYKQLVSEGVEGFPNGCKLVKVLAKINSMPWFQPNQELDRGLLRKLVDIYLGRLNPPEPSEEISLEIIKKDWNVALKAARGITKDVMWEEIFKAARKAARDQEWNVIYDMVRDGVESVVWEVVRNPILDGAAMKDASPDEMEEAVDGAWNVARSVAYDAAGCAAWIIVSDLMPEEGYPNGNPFEVLIEIYQMGCWPIGQTVRDQKKQFLVFIPARNIRVSGKSR